MDHPLNEAVLRLRAPAAFAVHQLAKHMPVFQALFPQVSVELCTRNRRLAGAQAQDLTIQMRQPPRGAQLQARRLARTEAVLCASPDYLDRHGRPRHPAELSQHKLLRPPVAAARGAGPAAGALLLRPAGEGAVPRAAPPVLVQPRARACISTIDLDLVYASALSGLGICGLPSFVVEDALLENVLERVLPRWHLHTASLWLCRPAGPVLPAATQAMLDFLHGTFGGREDDPWLAAVERATRSDHGRPSAQAAA